MKRYLVALFYLVSCIAYPVRAANTDIQAYSGSGTLNNIDVFRIAADGSVVLSTSTGQNYQIFSATGSSYNKNLTVLAPNDINLGTTATAISSSTAAGTSQGIVFTALLGGVNAAAEGSVLIATTQVVGQGITVAVSNGSDQVGVVGVAVAAASTGSVVNIYDTGWINCLTTGTVIPGDRLVTSSLSAGYAATVTTSTNGVMGIALSSGTSAGGLTKIKFGR